MLDEETDVNTKDQTTGNSALHMACANGHTEIVKLLIEHKANHNILNNSKNTPLRKSKSRIYRLFIDWAALNGRCDIIEILMTVGADANLKNEFDHVPLEEALQNGFTQAAEILAKFTKLSDDKLYTSIVEEPEKEEEEKKEEDDELFPEED